jgi:hypothetical protein
MSVVKARIADRIVRLSKDAMFLGAFAFIGLPAQRKLLFIPAS